MTVKSSISLTDEQDAYMRDLVEQGRYPSVSAVLQHGLALLQRKTEGEDIELAALKALVEARRQGPFVTSTSMKGRIAALAERKRRAHGL